MLRFLPLAFLGFVSTALAADFTPPPGSVSLLGQGLEGFSTNTQKLDANLETTPDGKVWKISGPGPFTNEYEVELHSPTTADVKKGDVIFASVTLRGTAQNETESAETTLVFQRNKNPWNKSLILPIDLTPEWKTYTAGFVADADYKAGEAAVLFQLGYPKQTLEISKVEFLDYGSKVALKDLPSTKITYAGREADAAWRKEAEERIEKIRKGPLTIRVVDPDGQPVTGAEVKVSQTRHAFLFGSAAVAGRILGDKDDDQKYRETFLSMFDAAVFENDMKWPDWDHSDREKVFQALDWLDAHHIAVRGHCLVWPSWIFSPKYLRDSEHNWLELRQRIDSHIRDEVTALKGRLKQWDVINETFTNHQITDIVGRDALPHWFKLAHDCDPQPILFLNDYAAFMNGGRNTAHKDAFEETVNYLKSQDAPIGGIGLQSHFNSRVSPPEKLLTELDRWAALNLQISVTEFDIDTTDEQLQADYTRDFLTAIFSSPSVSALLTWGFWEGAHWKPDAALVRKDWTDRPAGKVWRDLVRGKWWTTEDLKTDQTGEVSLRGFQGAYTITAIQGDLTGETQTEITTKDTEATVYLKKKPAPTPTPGPTPEPSPSPSPSASPTTTPLPSPSAANTTSPSPSPSPSPTPKAATN